MERIKEGPIAHRGGIPENTITAFTIAKKSGASTIEVDLRFSKDGHPVLFHDRKVDRVSDQSGNLADLTLDQIKSLDVGHKFGYPGARVPTLTEGVEAIKELDLHMFLEIKRCDKHGINMLAELFQQDPSLYDQIIVISFYPDILYKLKLVDPNIVIGLLIRGTVFTHPPPDMIIIPNDSSWKRVLAFFVEKITNWLLLNHIWKILGTQVLLPHKEDILNNRYPLIVTLLQAYDM
jgi:glycerophosphoinositol glycerophosphodiesterase